MSERNTLSEWWRAVPDNQKQGLKMLLGIFMVVMTLASAAVIYVTLP